MSSSTEIRLLRLRKSINRGGKNTNGSKQLMTGYTKFAVIGAGTLGNYVVQQLLKDKAAGIVKEVVVLTRQV